jgi:protoporphyrinogen oxidase
MITTPEQVDMITTLAREELTIVVDAMTCYGTFDRVILTTPEWVNMIITFARTELTAFEWVNSTITVWINMIFPEGVNIVQEWLLVTTAR